MSARSYCPCPELRTHVTPRVIDALAAAGYHVHRVGAAAYVHGKAGHFLFGVWGPLRARTGPGPAAGASSLPATSAAAAGSTSSAAAAATAGMPAGASWRASPGTGSPRSRSIRSSRPGSPWSTQRSSAPLIGGPS